ncbi:MAG: hypothetical protein RQ875_05605 [Vicingaceae bacterium]|nr:hypothetical protein [Vicingaceae bacterium]
MSKFILFIALLLPLTFYAQEDMRPSGDKKASGMFELGVRNTISAFGSTNNMGTGFGGQFRIRISNRINTEWFADFITEDIDGLAYRNDRHIGWSVMFYPLNTQGKLVPYILAGHCFDYTKVSPVKTTENIAVYNAQSRLSSATQLGIGTHLNITNNFDVSFGAQYMIHLGNDIHTDIHEHDGIKELHIEKENHNNPTLEGHLLFTISVNFKLGNLW